MNKEWLQNNELFLFVVGNDFETPDDYLYTIISTMCAGNKTPMIDRVLMSITDGVNH